MFVIRITNIVVCIDVLGLPKKYEVHKACICNDFRSEHTLKYQNNFIKNLVSPI